MSRNIFIGGNSRGNTLVTGNGNSGGQSGFGVVSQAEWHNTSGSTPQNFKCVCGSHREAISNCGGGDLIWSFADSQYVDAN
jgi:hypothetical protein